MIKKNKSPKGLLFFLIYDCQTAACNVYLSVAVCDLALCRGVDPQPGLTGNPGKEAAVFSDDHPYFPKDCKNCIFYTADAADNVRLLLKNEKKDCNHCQYINRCIDNVGQAEKERIKANIIEYQRYLSDPDYKNVKFDERSGGVYAEHILHSNQDNNKDRFFGNMSGTDLEMEFADTAFHSGHSVIMRQEGTIREIIDKQFFYNRELDTIIDGRLADIASVTKDKNSYEYILLRKNGQLLEFNAQHGTDADTVILYFHDESMYSEQRINRSMENLLNLHKYAKDEKGKVIKDESGNPIFSDELYEIKIKHIICATKTGMWREFHI